MKIAIVTGASSGIGRAISLALSKEYDYIGICSRTNTAKLDETASLIRAKGCSCGVWTGDVGDYSFAAQMVNDIAANIGSPTLLINNAGISSVGLFTDMTPDEWNRIFTVNVTSVYNFCHAVIPFMVHEKAGRIINISSVWGLVGASCEAAYSASKGAVNGLSLALAKELAPSNIAVNAVAFGAIDTSMNGHLTPSERSTLEEEISFGRMGTPMEAGDFVARLADMPAYFTGEVSKFDGAWI